MKKGESAHFLELQVQQAISETIYVLETSGLAYLTCCNLYFMILHYLWLRVKSKLFSRVKNVKNGKSSFFEIPSFDDFALKSKLNDFTRSRGFLKRITYINPCSHFLRPKI